MNTAVITGATGMLGLALMRRLIRADFFIYAVVRKSSPRTANIPRLPNIKIIECDLSELAKLKALIEDKCSLFFHLGWEGTYGASRNNAALQTENIKFTLDAVRAAYDLGCNTFLMAGSQAEYGRKKDIISPHTPTEPESGYGIAKLCAGQMSRLLCKELKIKHIHCRIFSAYGPYDGINTMLMCAMQNLLKGKRASFTKGEQLWDYLYCDDAAEALYLAAVKGTNGSIYCVGSGQARPLKAYIQALAAETHAPRQLLGLGDIPYGENQVMYLCADISSLTADTGFMPKYSFEEGIKNTVAWYKAHIIEQQHKDTENCFDI